MAIDPASAASAYANAARHQSATEIGGSPPTAGSPTGPNFADFVQDALSAAVDTGHQAEQVAVDAAAGEADIVDVVTAISAAEMTLETVVSVRDRMVSAYQEIMRMPI